MKGSLLQIPIPNSIQDDSLIGSLFTLAKDSFVYLIGTVVVGLGNFILVPLYTRYLPPAEFGVYSLLDVTILVVVTITQLGLGVSYLKWYAEIGESKRADLLGSVLLVGTTSAIVGGSLVTIVMVSPLGGQWLQTEERSFAWIMAPIVMLENVQGLLLADLRARRKSVAFSLGGITRLLAIVGASLWFIVIQKEGVNGVFLGRLVGDGIGVLVLLFLCFHSAVPGFARSIIAPMIRYGLPLVWSAFMGMMLDASGRYFLGHYSTMEQVGFYGAAIKIGNIFQMLVYQPFGVAWGGLMFQIAKWPNARVIYSKILVYVFVISLSAAFILALFTSTLFAVFATETYAPAMAVFPLILLVRAINIMEYPAAIGIYLGGHTKYFGLIYSIGLAVNVAGNYVLTPAYGMFGAAWAWLVAWMTITLLMAWIGQRYYPLHYDWKLFAFPIILWGLFLMDNGKVLLGFREPIQFLLALIVVLGVGVFLARDVRNAYKYVIRERPGCEDSSGRSI
ncbi:MAG: polysaccharide biosynthesis protein [Thermoflexales bacterium]|nr:polysaccharide biosynthesis protein [Thermoflexales bacterium]